MSILSRTPNLGLTQFDGDIATHAGIYSRYNSDMLKIDGHFGEYESTINQQIADMQTDITGFESRVSSDVDELTTLVNSYEERISTLENCCSDVNTTLTDYGSRIEVLEETVASLDPQYVADLRQRLTALEEKVDTNATAIESLNEDINRLEIDISSLATRMASAESRITVTEADISYLKQCCINVGNRLDDLQSQITSNDADISALQNRMSIAENNIDANARDITTVATQTRVNTTDIAELKTRVGDVEDSIGDMQTLRTTDKSSLVGAINEIYGSSGLASHLEGTYDATEENLTLFTTI